MVIATYFHVYIYVCDRETQVECFNQFVKSMDDSVKQLCGTMERSAKKYEECKYGWVACWQYVFIIRINHGVITQVNHRIDMTSSCCLLSFTEIAVQCCSLFKVYISSLDCYVSLSLIPDHAISGHLIHWRVSFDVHTTRMVTGALLLRGRGSGTFCWLNCKVVTLLDNSSGVWRHFYLGRGTTALCDAL